MIYTEAPNKFSSISQFNWDTLFLAGSITGAINWQEFVTKQLLPYYHIFNPRRENFDGNNMSMEREQITWEYEHLQFCENILFWFSYETLAPITLLELGTLFSAAKDGTKNVFIGIHPEYKRKNDVLIQTELRAPNLSKNIVFDLNDLVKQVINNKKK